MKLVDVKKKIREHVTKERVVAFVGFAVGTAGFIVADYYRREMNRRSEFEPWSSIPVYDHAVEKMRNGAVLKARMRIDGNSSFSQTTTADDFTDYQNERFENWTPSEW